MRQVAGVEQAAGRPVAEVGARVPDVEAHAPFDRLGELGCDRPGRRVELAASRPEGVGDDVAGPERGEQRLVGDGRRVREPPEVHHHRLVARHLLGAREERAVRVVARVGGPHLEADHDVVVGRERRRGRVEVEVALVVGDAQLVADEVTGGQVELARVHERQHTGGGGRPSSQLRASVNVATPLVPPSTTTGTPVCTPARSGSTQKSPRPGNTWAWRSIRPGVTTSPVQSTTSTSAARPTDAGAATTSSPAPGPTAVIRPPDTTTSAISSVPEAGSMTRPPRSTSGVAVAASFNMLLNVRAGCFPGVAGW